MPETRTWAPLSSISMLDAEAGTGMVSVFDIAGAVGVAGMAGSGVIVTGIRMVSTLLLPSWPARYCRRRLHTILGLSPCA